MQLSDVQGHRSTGGGVRDASRVFKLASDSTISAQSECVTCGSGTPCKQRQEPGSETIALPER